MSLQMNTVFNGISISNAIFTIEYITIQNGQLDFYVSARVRSDTPILFGDNYGCSYDQLMGTPEEQANNHLRSLEAFKNSVYTP